MAGEGKDRRRRRWRADRAFAALAVVSLFTVIALWTHRPGQLVVIDEARALDRSAIETAARPLLGRGASLAVIAVARGGSGEDLTRRLDTAGLGSRSGIAPHAIAVYISFEPRHSELRAGANWRLALPPPRLRALRHDALNPALRRNETTAGAADVIRALDRQIAFPALLRALGRAGLWLVLVTGALLAGVFLLDRRRRLHALAASPAGKAVRGWWDRTPPGRARARDRLRAEMEQERRRLESRAAAALSAARSSLRKGDPALRAGLEAREQKLAQRREELLERALDEPDLAVRIRRLIEEHEQYGTLAQKLGELERSASAARQRLSEVLAFDGPLPKPPRKRGNKGDPPPPLVPPAELAERLAALDRRRAELAERLPDGEQVRLERAAKGLCREYEQVGRDTHTVWALIFPERAAAEARESEDWWHRLKAQERHGPTQAAAGSAAASPAWIDLTPDVSDPSTPSSDGGEW